MQFYSYVASQNPAAADDLFAGIDRKLENLSHFPFIGRQRAQLAPGLRSLVIGNYVIFYVVGREEITIVRVVDGRMDLDEEFRR
jgi:toxin ParE1/3/4